MKRRLEGGSSIGVGPPKKAPSPAAAGLLPAEPAFKAPSVGGSELDELTEDERRALRASRFAGTSAAAAAAGAAVTAAAERPQGPGTARGSAAQPIGEGAPTIPARAPRHVATWPGRPPPSFARFGRTKVFQKPLLDCVLLRDLRTSWGVCVRRTTTSLFVLLLSPFKNLSGPIFHAHGTCRLAHPNGPIATNKAAALMRFLERRVNTGATANLDPRLVECAVRNAQQSLKAPAEVIKNVEKFDDDVPYDSQNDLETIHGKTKAHASWTSGSKAKKSKKKNHTHGKDKNHKQEKHKKKYS